MLMKLEMFGCSSLVGCKTSSMGNKGAALNQIQFLLPEFYYSMHTFTFILMFVQYLVLFLSYELGFNLSNCKTNRDLKGIKLICIYVVKNIVRFPTFLSLLHFNMSISFLVLDHVKQEPREEFSDWPHGLLAIGTFGNNDLKGNPRSEDTVQQGPSDIQDSELSSSDDLQEFSIEEVGKLQKELTKLLSRKPNSDAKKEVASLPLDRFLNCPSSLEVDRRFSSAVCSDSGDRTEEDIDRTISIILGRCKDMCGEDDKRKAIGKKSISFLLKRMFVCSSGFSPAPSLRDTLQESRMEKLLRVMLHKKIYGQNPNRAPPAKKYLEDKQTPKRQKKPDEPQERKSEDGGKWVKTDSEYIVLEI
ncbi:hypothetical protein GQ457_14G007170 [Hibiscus cannabinus]